jgi:hypothetical protein
MQFVPGAVRPVPDRTPGVGGHTMKSRDVNPLGILFWLIPHAVLWGSLFIAVRTLAGGR